MEIKYLGDSTWKNKILKDTDVTSITPVKVGIIDGPINSLLFENFKEHKNFSKEPTNKFESIHTAIVCSIINDIAPASEIYIAEVAPKDNVPMPTRVIVEALHWLVTEKKVNLINMSLGFYNNCTGECDWEERFKILKEKYNVDVIVSAGNTSVKHPKASITCPGCSTSVITVGALDELNEIDNNINLENQILGKPECYANGHIKVKFLDNTWRKVSGTSFSAPIITGLISKHYSNMQKSNTYPIALNNLNNLKSYFTSFSDIKEKIEEAIELADAKYPELISIEKQEILDALNILMPNRYKKTAL